MTADGSVVLGFLTGSEPMQRARRRSLKSDCVFPAVERLEDRCLLAAGALDTTFDGGIVDTTIPGDIRGFFVAHASARQQDGKLVIVGATLPGAVTPFNYQGVILAAWLNADGSTDTSFGADGMIIVGRGVGTQVAVQPDGKILVAGAGELGGSYVFRLDADGHADPTFNGDGRIVSDVFGNGHVNGFTLMTDGRIVVSRDSMIFRYLANGGPDNTFDGDGIFNAAPFTENNIIEGIAVQPDGKIVASYETGKNSISTPFELRAVRLNIDGSLDTTFGTGGTASAVFTGFNGSAAIEPTLTADGKIYLSGYVLGGFVSARLNSNGTLDNTYDGDGKQTTAFGIFATAQAATVQPDGKLVLAGTLNSEQANMLTVRYRVDGSLDPTWEGDGIAQIDVGGLDEAEDVTRLPDGSFILTGGAGAVVKLNATGALDNSFSQDGRAIIIPMVPTGRYDLSNGVAAITLAQDVAVQPDGKSIVVGRRD